MKKINKKGFTIVELVIVIAVVAILAAVLIPTFAGLIQRANLSVDQQTAKNLDTMLKAESAINKPESMQDVCDKLRANGYIFKDMSPKSENYIFAWDKASNSIILISTSSEVVYPSSFDRSAANINVLVKDLSEAEKYSQFANTIALGKSMVATSNVDLNGKTIDLNGYTLDAQNGATIAASKVFNGRLTPAAKTALGSAEINSDTKEIVAIGTTENPATEEQVHSAAAINTAEKTVELTDRYIFVSGGASAIICGGKKTAGSGNILLQMDDSKTDGKTLTIEGCVFEGTTEIEIDNFENVVLKDCVFRISNATGGALKLWYGLKNIYIEGCRFEGSQRGMQIAGSSGCDFQNITVKDCYFSLAGAGTNGAMTDSNMAIQFAHGRFNDNLKVVIEGNEFVNCYGAVRLHETIFASTNYSDAEDATAAETGMKKTTIANWTAKNGSWITFSNNTYASGCGRGVYLDVTGAGYDELLASVAPKCDFGK